jgi:hypothetical protein
MGRPPAEPVPRSTRTSLPRAHATPGVRTDGGAAGDAHSPGVGGAGATAAVGALRAAPTGGRAVPVPNDLDHGAEEGTPLGTGRHDGRN